VVLDELDNFCNTAMYCAQGLMQLARSGPGNENPYLHPLIYALAGDGVPWAPAKWRLTQTLDKFPEWEENLVKAFRDIMEFYREVVGNSDDEVILLKLALMKYCDECTEKAARWYFDLQPVMR
jgi:hypothetical protein